MHLLTSFSSMHLLVAFVCFFGADFGIMNLHVAFHKSQLLGAMVGGDSQIQ